MTTRRDQVPFDPYYFERLARRGMNYSPREAFDYIYRNRHWAGKESVSGEGASHDQTAQLRVVLPELLRELETHTLLGPTLRGFQLDAPSDSPGSPVHWG